MSCCAWRLLALVLFYVLYLVMGALVFARIEAPLGNIVSAFIRGPHRNNLNLRMEFLDIHLTIESFAPCYSQSLLPADLTENHTHLWF